MACPVNGIGLKFVTRPSAICTLPVRSALIRLEQVHEGDSERGNCPQNRETQKENGERSACCGMFAPPTRQILPNGNQENACGDEDKTVRRETPTPVSCIRDVKNDSVTHKAI
jgi:hypothetical protein